MLGRIDLLAGEQRGAPRLEPCRAGKRREQLHGAPIRPVLGEVEQEIVEPQAEALEAIWIRREEIARAPRRDIAAMVLERGKGRVNVGARHV